MQEDKIRKICPIGLYIFVFIITEFYKIVKLFFYKIIYIFKMYNNFYVSHIVSLYDSSIFNLENFSIYKNVKFKSQYYCHEYSRELYMCIIYYNLIINWNGDIGRFYYDF